MPAAAADSATAAPVTVPVAELISHTSVVIKPHYLASDSGIGSDFELVMLCVKDGRRNRKIDFSSTHLTHSLSRIENFFACAAPRVVVTYGDGKRVVAALEDAKLRRGEDHCKDRDVMLRLSAVQLLDPPSDPRIAKRWLGNKYFKREKVGGCKTLGFDRIEKIAPAVGGFEIVWSYVRMKKRGFWRLVVWEGTSMLCSIKHWMECGRCAGCPVIDDALPDSAVTNGEYDDFVLEYGWEKKDESESEGEEDDIWSC